MGNDDFSRKRSIKAGLPQLSVLRSKGGTLLFDEKTGGLAFERACAWRLPWASRELLGALKEAGASPGFGRVRHIGLSPCPAAGRFGTRFALREDRLAAVTLTAVWAGQRTALTAEQQRAFLFAAFRAQDPCPDTQRNCVLHCAFGTVALCTDPRSGHASARVEYSESNDRPRA